MVSSVQKTREFKHSELVEPFIDLSFPLRGKQLPADHGYALLSAISRYVPQIKVTLQF
jgi:hypothetical protein